MIQDSLLQWGTDPEATGTFMIQDSLLMGNMPRDNRKMYDDNRNIYDLGQPTAMGNRPRDNRNVYDPGQPTAMWKGPSVLTTETVMVPNSPQQCGRDLELVGILSPVNHKGLHQG